MFCALLLTGMLVLPLPARAATMESHVGAVTTGGGSLYVRQQPSTGAAVLTSLPKGSYVTLISRSGDWWQVEYSSGKYGYCYAGFITPVQGTPVRVDTGGNVLNVRTGPGTSYSRVATIPHGTVVLLRSSENGWSRIVYNGVKLGYVSSQYLRTDSPGSSGSTGYSAVYLTVPSFKQTDKRWANVTIGTSGKTIGAIGCATTGIAMMESYRTGTTIYPDAMSKKLTYTPSGSVYWPSHYSVVTRLDLNAIYDLLQQGKPVLLGAKKASGGQHWVVVTGFTGGAVTAANFTIGDPGSKSRTTLQQFFADYPTFYKYFHY